MTWHSVAMEFCEYLKEGERLILVPKKDSSSIYQADPMAFPKKALLLGQLRDLGQQSSTVIPGSLPLTCSKVPYSSRERKGEGKIYFWSPNSFLSVGSYSEQFLQFCSKWGGGRPGWGKGTEQPSVTGSAWPQGSWDGVYLKIPIGSSSISLWLQIRAN